MVVFISSDFEYNFYKHFYAGFCLTIKFQLDLVNPRCTIASFCDLLCLALWEADNLSSNMDVHTDPFLHLYFERFLNTVHHVSD